MSESRHPGLQVGHDDEVSEEENEKSSFGFWVFLMSDAVLFAILFANYAVYAHGTVFGPQPAEVLSLGTAFVETVLLLTSTLTMGFMSVALRHDDRTAAARWLWVTLLLGAAFLGLEAREFSDFATRGYTPQASAYLSAYFTLVGTHGIHVAAGVIWGLVMLAQLRVPALEGMARSRLVRLSLYWHLLDVVWVAIFSVVYLAGVAR